MRILVAVLIAVSVVAASVLNQHGHRARRSKMQYPHSADFNTYDKDNMLQSDSEDAKECPDDEWPCPTKDYNTNAWVCIRYRDLCNELPQCPQAEDEHPSLCMYHRLLDDEINSMKKHIANVIRTSMDFTKLKEVLTPELVAHLNLETEQQEGLPDKEAEDQQSSKSN